MDDASSSSAAQAGGLAPADVREYRTIDKSGWLRGAWDSEPDKRQWADVFTGLPCLIVRGPHGGLCGYVGVHPDHPWHGRGYSADVEVDRETLRTLFTEANVQGLYSDHIEAGVTSPEACIMVHGGLTFARGCQHGDDPAKGICHIPAAGEHDDVWWFGFDCAHGDDYSPAHDRRHEGPTFGAVYRDARYVANQVGMLAEQLALIADASSQDGATRLRPRTDGETGPGRNPKRPTQTVDGVEG